MMNRFTSSIWFALLALSLAGNASGETRPNIIVVMTDDQGYGDLSCHGNSDVKTPHLDQLHSESIRFTNFHVDPTCAPTRAALLTGRYSLSTGVWHTIAGRSFLHPDEVTVANVLGEAGYATGMFGKWHLGDNYPCRHTIADLIKPSITEAAELVKRPIFGAMTISTIATFTTAKQNNTKANAPMYGLMKPCDL